MTNMYIKIWGVRGSVPVSGADTIRYGGNTSCIEVYNDDGDRMVLDAGTGIRVFGMSLDPLGRHNIDIYISHPHWDHINGLLFLPFLFIPNNVITIHGPRTCELSLEEIVRGQMQYTYFPVSMDELAAELNTVEITKGQFFDKGHFHVKTIRLNHPVECLGYRIEYNKKSFVYLADNEPYYDVYGDGDPEIQRFVDSMNGRLVEFIRDADCVIADAQYLPSEYESKKGWGHSTTHHVVNMALKANVKHVLFSHHDPVRTDKELDTIVAYYRAIIAEKGFKLKIDAAAEGNIITL